MPGFDSIYSFSDYFTKRLGPLKSLKHFKATRTNVFVSYPVQKSGVLAFVEYFSYRTGAFYIGGWRRNVNNNDVITRAWEIMITCQSTGMNKQVSFRLIKC